MKKIISILISAIMLFSVFATVSVNAKTIEISGKNASELVETINLGWNLGNSLDAYNANYDENTPPSKFVTAWGNPEPTMALILAVKSAGFNTVRLPVRWCSHMKYDESSSKYVINSQWLAYVKSVVDMAYNQGMFVVLTSYNEDFYVLPQFTNASLAISSKKMADLWSAISEAFADYDQRLIFDGMKEPRQTSNANVPEWGNGSGDDGYSWSFINSLNETFISTVRKSSSANNQERLLLITPYVSSSDNSALNALTTPAGSSNIAISLNAYTPYFFAIDTSEMSDHSFPGQSGYGEVYETSISNLFSSLKTVKDSKNLPIIVTEFGAADFQNSEARVAWAKYYLSAANSAGIKCMVYDNNMPYDGTGQAFEIFNRSDNSVYPNSLDMLIAMLNTVGVANPIFSDGSNSADVKGTYTPGSTTETVYSVDVIWGNMEFTYKDASQGKWNPKTHKYDDAVAAKWSCTDDANKITVKNHSNAAVTATPSYTPASGFTAVTGGFNTGARQLASAVNTAVTAAPSAEWTLSLSGALASSITSSTILGTVTITIE